MISDLKIKDLGRQGYRIVGNHSAVKVCLWTKKCIRNEDICYKNAFYGIKSNRCVQMTPSLNVCSHRCIWCWRDISFTVPEWKGPIDEPEKIIDGCVSEHIKYLQGFGGNKKANKQKYQESLNPRHFAISLSGEPTSYPALPGLIQQLRKREISSFLVTNGTNPSMLGNLLQMNAQPTQLYITLPAPDEETYRKVCRPLEEGAWDKIMQSLSLVSKFKRGTIRLTLVKGWNMLQPEGYAKLIEKNKPLFVELKAYMHVGHSKLRLKIGNMPRHSEILAFAKEIHKNSSYKLIEEKEESRVCLMMVKDIKGRKLPDVH